jgi:hypothetical protein
MASRNFRTPTRHFFIGFLCPVPHISFRWCTHQRYGEACMQFGHIIRRAKGLHILIKRKGHIKEVLHK